MKYIDSNKNIYNLLSGSIKSIMRKNLTSKVASSILAFIFIFFTGWSAARLLVQTYGSESTYDYIILGGFSFVLGILELYRLTNSK